MYYVIEISTGDTSIAGKAIYEYSTEAEAMGTFHRKLGNAYLSPLFTSELVMVHDANGACLRSEKYTRPAAPEIPEEPTE